MLLELDVEDGRQVGRDESTLRFLGGELEICCSQRQEPVLFCADLSLTAAVLREGDLPKKIDGLSHGSFFELVDVAVAVFHPC